MAYRELEEAFSKHWLDYILKRNRIEWDWTKITSNSILTETTIRSHPECPWVDSSSIFNYSLSWEWFEERLSLALDQGKLPYSGQYSRQEEEAWGNNNVWYNGYIWKLLSEHPCVTLEHVLKWRDHPWDYSALLENPSMSHQDITGGFLELLPDTTVEELYAGATANRNISIDYILAHPEIKWAWNEIVQRPDLTLLEFDRLLKMKPSPFELCQDDYKHTWMDISRFPSLTEQYLLDNFDLPWNWVELSRNPSITLDIIERHPDWSWYSKYLSENPHLTWEYVRDHMDRDWNWVNLSKHPNIKWCDIESNPNFPWNWYWVSQNPNIGWDIVDRVRDKPWNFEHLAGNLMPCYRERWMEKEGRRRIAALRLHRFFRDVSCNPAYAFARKRLHRICSE